MISVDNLTVLFFLPYDDHSLSTLDYLFLHRVTASKTGSILIFNSALWAEVVGCIVLGSYPHWEITIQPTVFPNATIETSSGDGGAGMALLPLQGSMRNFGAALPPPPPTPVPTCARECNSTQQRNACAFLPWHSASELKLKAAHGSVR